MKESLKLAVELAKRGESEGIGTVYRKPVRMSISGLD